MFHFLCMILDRCSIFTLSNITPLREALSITSQSPVLLLHHINQNLGFSVQSGGIGELSVGHAGGAGELSLLPRFLVVNSPFCGCSKTLALSPKCFALFFTG